MSTYTNVGEESQEDPSPHPSRAAESCVEEADYLQPVEEYLQPVEDYLQPVEDYLQPVDDYLPPTEQRGAYYSEPHIYEDIDWYRARGQQQQCDEIPLLNIAPGTQGHEVTTGRDAGPEPGPAGDYLQLLPLPADRPDRPACTNRTRKWFVIGLAVAVVIGAAVAIGISVTGKGDTDECQSSPCRNGGTCEDLIDGIKCHCLPGYSGIVCQNDTDECQSSPCRNGGSCVDRINEYACQCPPGYSGTSCQTDTDECESSPCRNGGTCEDRVGGFTCHCHPRYSGNGCQTENTGCDSKPCLHGSMCSARGNHSTCHCLPGYSGTLCQGDIDECESGPCLNLGTCVDRVNGYTCHCLLGYSGTSCQTDTDECVSSPCLNGGTCEDRVNGYTCLCRPRYGGAHCQGSKVAFSAYHPTPANWTRSWRRVEYGRTMTDLGGAYRDSTLYSTSTDLYYVAMVDGTLKYVNYRLVGAPHSPGLSTTSTNRNEKSVGRAGVLEIASQSEISVQYTGEVMCCLGTSWSMFSLTAAFHPLVAFTVTRTTPTTELGKVPFTESLINTGDGYRPADSHFVAPSDGSYYFTVSAGVAAHQKARLHIVKNDVRQVELLYTDTTHNGKEMPSTAVIVNLSRGDRVHVELAEGAVFSGPEFRETSFSGFLYSPLHGQSIAWSVWRTDSWTGKYLQPVPYNTVVVNEGDVYNTSQHVVTVPVSGVYCVHIVGGTARGRGMNLVIGYGRSFSDLSDNTANAISDWTDRNGETTVSGSVLLTLEAGDLVWVWAWGWEGYGFFSSPGRVTGFSGFLVYPT